MADISVPRGTKRTFDLPVDQGRGGEDYDLTGVSLRGTFKVRTTDADADAVLVKTIGAGITVTDAGTGAATFTLEPEDTEDLAEHSALVYEIQVTDTAGDPFLIQRGRLFVTPRSTTTVP